MLDIVEATQLYEAWLGKLIPINQADLEIKHKAMRVAAFSFLRATFYRWVQTWPGICTGAVNGPNVLAVGDLHIENFGTWRDREGRLAWGINDFDEAYLLPYTNDLVRLATSALVASQDDMLAIRPENACSAILAGYQKCLENGRGQPFVLSENHQRLREMALNTLRDPLHFWGKMDQCPLVEDISPDLRTILNNAMPDPSLELTIIHRTAGLGSLGRQRYTAIATWCGGRIAREMKRLTVSAAIWENSSLVSGSKIYYPQILQQAIRNPDPFTQLAGDWVVRRLAPDCSRIELTSLPKQQDEARLLSVMGWETANIHLGSGEETAKKILGDLRHQPEDWLCEASRLMCAATVQDWKVWKKYED